MSYKIYKDSYLKSLTKDELIGLLRIAEHNYLATEEALQNSSTYGKQLAEDADIRISDFGMQGSTFVIVVFL